MVEPMSEIQGTAAEVVDGVRAAFRRDPAQRAIVFEGTWYDWQWVCRAAENLLDALRRAQAQPNEVIGFVARNRPNASAALLGLLSAPYSIRMIYAFQSAESLAKDIERIGMRLIILDAKDAVQPVLNALGASGTAAVILDEGGGAHVLGQPRALLPQDAAGSEPVIQLLTSGTTGAPKVHTTSFGLIAKRIVGSNVSSGALRAATPAYAFFALGNISGIYNFVPAALSGTPLYLVEKFSIESWLDWVRTYRPSAAVLPPPAFRSILDANVPKADLASLTTITTGSAALDLKVQLSFEERYDIPILMSFGATEFSGPIAVMTPALYAEWGKRKVGSVGRAYGGASLRVVDAESGAPLPPGEVGILEVRLEHLGPDWVRTSDMATIDADGFMFHRGRADGAIVRGGFKMLPEGIERALLQHPVIAAAAVVGLPHERLGQVPAAVIEIAHGQVAPTESELEAHLRAHLTAPQIPAAYRIVSALPRTPILKPDLRAIRALFDDVAG
jgi:long-chain acyl-CoA synthetase